MVKIYIGLDVHKRSVYITEIENDGTVKEQYQVENSMQSWNAFRERYLPMSPEIALETSTSGKYAARLLRDMGFSIHLADPSRLALIFNTAKKNDREDSYKLAKLLRLGELPETHLPSREADDLRTLARYRKSLGEEGTRAKNKVHAMLAMHGITIKATDVFGIKGLREMERYSENFDPAEKVVLNSLLHMVIELRKRCDEIEDEMARIGKRRKDVGLLLSIPGINVYSAVAIVSEIDDISRFRGKEKLASYAGLTPKQNQSGSRDIRGHISKRGPSMLRFILVNAAHSIIRYSKRMRIKYLHLVRKTGKKRAVIAIARILAEIIFIMLSRNVKFMDDIDPLTERKVVAMSQRARNPRVQIDIEGAAKLLRSKEFRGMSSQAFS